MCERDDGDKGKVSPPTAFGNNFYLTSEFTSLSLTTTVLQLDRQSQGPIKIDLWRAVGHLNICRRLDCNQIVAWKKLNDTSQWLIPKPTVTAVHLCVRSQQCPFPSGSTLPKTHITRPFNNWMIQNIPVNPFLLNVCREE